MIVPLDERTGGKAIAYLCNIATRMGAGDGQLAIAMLCGALVQVAQALGVTRDDFLGVCAFNFDLFSQAAQRKRDRENLN